jgi:hypothetical protein
VGEFQRFTSRGLQWSGYERSTNRVGIAEIGTGLSMSEQCEEVQPGPKVHHTSVTLRPQSHGIYERCCLIQR